MLGCGSISSSPSGRASLRKASSNASVGSEGFSRASASRSRWASSICAIVVALGRGHRPGAISAPFRDLPADAFEPGERQLLRQHDSELAVRLLHYSSPPDCEFVRRFACDSFVRLEDRSDRDGHRSGCQLEEQLDSAVIVLIDRLRTDPVSCIVLTR